eukprot:3941961-Rhodomonas_salina.14
MPGASVSSKITAPEIAPNVTPSEAGSATEAMAQTRSSTDATGSGSCHGKQARKSRSLATRTSGLTNWRVSRLPRSTIDSMDAERAKRRRKPSRMAVRASVSRV